MGKTIIEKILQNHTREEVAPGKIVWVNLDVRSARDFGGANVVKHFNREFAGRTVADSSRTLFTFDCVVPANTIAYAENQQVCRVFAHEQSIQLHDVDAGIGTHVMIEEGIALPGYIVVGTDSHLNILGAIGCFGQGMGDQDIAFAFGTGKTWFEVPETIKINIEGTYQYPTGAKDLVLFILKHLGAAGALGRCVELYGTAVERLSLAGRITVASMGTEMGAIAIFIPPSDSVLEYCRHRSNLGHIQGVYADSDAQYVREINLDINGLGPQVALPPHPHNVANVEDLPTTTVDSVFIGSCTNGTLEDMEEAAGMFRGKKVARGVMAKVVPATRKVYGEMLRGGLLEVFYNAGVIVSNPGCGGCAQGQIGMTGTGEVQVSTSNRNFKGKQGAGLTYLASPTTAAASAVAGRIASWI